MGLNWFNVWFLSVFKEKNYIVYVLNVVVFEYVILYLYIKLLVYLG